jgi:hypothetical protein
MVKDSVMLLFQSGINVMNSNYHKVDIPQIIPSSPQSQIFEKYLNHPVTEYNGIPQIEIPLYEISIKGLTIPVTLSYHAGGIKYKQYDGDIGLGWSINIGGYRVTRSIYGRDDEEYAIYSQSEANRYLSGSEGPGKKDLYLAKVGLSSMQTAMDFIQGTDFYPLQDSEYDQFSYMLPSTNGQFLIIDRSKGTIQKFEENLDKVKLTNVTANSSLLDSILITDKSGFLYYLGGKVNPNPIPVNPWRDLLVEYVSNETAMKSAWPLKKIKSPFNETISFEYISNQATEKSFINSSIIASAATFTIEGNIDQQRSSISPPESEIPISYMQLLVSKIVGEQEIITFLRDAQGKLLKIIIDNKHGDNIKTISFEYSTVNINDWHRKLIALTIGTSSLKKEKYQFDYYASPSNEIKYCYPDQWGYYRKSLDVCKSTSIHKEFLNHNILDEFRTGGVSAVKPLKNSYMGAEFQLYTNDRSLKQDLLGKPSSSYVPNYFSLRRITFPTGGTVEYDYENNQYKEYQTLIEGAGIRIKNITTRTDNNEYITEYSYSTGVSNFENLITGERNFADASFHFMFESLMSFVATKQIYSQNPLLSEMSNFSVSYPKVIIREYDILRNSYNGKKVITHEVPSQYKISPYNNQAECYYGSGHFSVPSSLDYTVGEFYKGRKPIKIKQEIYDLNEKIIQIDNFFYKNPVNNSFSNIKVKYKLQFDLPCNLLRPNELSYIYRYVSSVFDYRYYNIHTGANNILEKQETIIYTNNDSIKNTDVYTYDDKLRVIKTTKTNSLNGSLEQTFSYPGIGSQLDTKNMVNTIIETVTKNNNKEIGRIKNFYHNSKILSDSVQTSASGLSNMRTDIKYDRYDTKGNIQQYTTIDGISTIYLWSYSGQYPIAEIKGATYQEVETAAKSAFGVASIDILSQKSSVTEAQLNNFRNHTSVKNAMITTYTYKPLVGMLTATDPRGVTTYYEYDTFGRLKDSYIEELDSSGQKVRRKAQSYEYNYQNQ